MAGKPHDQDDAQGFQARYEQDKQREAEARKQRGPQFYLDPVTQTVERVQD